MKRSFIFAALVRLALLFLLLLSVLLLSSCASSLTRLEGPEPIARIVTPAASQYIYNDAGEIIVELTLPRVPAGYRWEQGKNPVAFNLQVPGSRYDNDPWKTTKDIDVEVSARRYDIEARLSRLLPRARVFVYPYPRQEDRGEKMIIYGFDFYVLFALPPGMPVPDIDPARIIKMSDIILALQRG